MRGSIPLAVSLVLSGTLLLLVIASFPRGVSAQDGATSIGVDAVPQGNTATTLGDIDSCVSVDVGDTFQVDVFVKNATDLIAWEAYLFFDPSLVNVTDREVQLFQASSPNSNVFDTSESVPDDDGRYRVGAADIADPLAPDSGSGALATLTLVANKAGVSPLTVSLQPSQIEGYSIGPVLTAADGTHPEDSDEDGFFDGDILDAEVAVGQGCDGSVDVAGETEASGDGGGGIGTTVWIIVTAAGVASVATVGGVIIVRSRRHTAGHA